MCLQNFLDFVGYNGNPIKFITDKQVVYCMTVEKDYAYLTHEDTIYLHASFTQDPDQDENRESMTACFHHQSGPGSYRRIKIEYWNEYCVHICESINVNRIETNPQAHDDSWSTLNSSYGSVLI